MKNKVVSAFCAIVLTGSMLTGCGETAAPQSAAPAAPAEAPAAEAEAPAEEAPAEEEVSADEAAAEGEVTDEEAADRVAELIDAIYVQEWTPETEAQCAEAKAAWDALTDAQKELVEGESADPDYFGRDTGDASADDPLNQDEIGANELLVVSFGTSFNDSRAQDIGGIEKALAAAYPDWAVRRAFTAQIIMNHVLARDGEKIDNMTQALDRAVANGVKNLIIQPTHLMHGAEYDEMNAALDSYKDKFEKVVVAEPLLGEVGADASVINADKEAAAKAVVAEAVKAAGFETLEDADKDGTAFVLMGHGTSHTASVTYDQMQSQMNELGYKNVFIGTVEGEPEDTECYEVIDKVSEAGYKKVILRPLMVVAGDHANNDMAGDDEDSWKTCFTESEEFDSVDAQIEGLGRIAGIQDIYVAHTAEALKEMGDVAASASASGNEAEAASGNEAGADEASANEADSASADEAGTASIEATEALADGTYKADFKTDGKMFHVNEANNNQGDLTVKGGKMTIHISLPSKNILHLFPGKAADAQKDGATLLNPTIDKVTYSDGKTEEVNGYDVPVPAIGEEFDLALIGTKGKWYDHKVTVSNPVKS